MQSDALTRLALEALDDLKALDVQVLDVRELTQMTDYMIVATGRSNRQVVAIAEHLIMEAKNQGERQIGIEGLGEGEWVLVDLGDVLVHVMQPDTRDTYQLEKLWAPRQSTESGEPAGPQTQSQA
jgi:ribosome-associated protein